MSHQDVFEIIKCIFEIIFIIFGTWSFFWITWYNKVENDLFYKRCMLYFIDDSVQKKYDDRKSYLDVFDEFEKYRIAVSLVTVVFSVIVYGCWYVCLFVAGMWILNKSLDAIMKDKYIWDISYGTSKKDGSEKYLIGMVRYYQVFFVFWNFMFALMFWFLLYWLICNR